MKTFRLPRGIQVPDLGGIHEGFAIGSGSGDHSRITANVSAERIEEVFGRLAQVVSQPGFLVLELPCHQAVEEELRSDPSDPFHKDVYYWDGLPLAQLGEVFATYREFFVDDGLLEFGYGSHQGVDEVMVRKYKVFEVLSTDHGKYVAALTELGLERQDSLRTVWDTFTHESPGRCERIRVDGRTIHDMVEDLSAKGLYYSQRRTA